MPLFTQSPTPDNFQTINDQIILSPVLSIPSSLLSAYIFLIGVRRYCHLSLKIFLHLFKFKSGVIIFCCIPTKPFIIKMLTFYPMHAGFFTTHLFSCARKWLSSYTCRTYRSDPKLRSTGAKYEELTPQQEVLIQCLNLEITLNPYSENENKQGKKKTGFDLCCTSSSTYALPSPSLPPASPVVTTMASIITTRWSTVHHFINASGPSPNPSKHHLIRRKVTVIFFQSRFSVRTPSVKMQVGEEVFLGAWSQSWILSSVRKKSAILTPSAKQNKRHNSKKGYVFGGFLGYEHNCKSVSFTCLTDEDFCHPCIKMK